jgi:hypothetical protein
VIKVDFLQALHKFHDLNDPSFDCLNTTYYLLLPKKEDPLQITDYRPISLIHAFAKLVSIVVLGYGPGKAHAVVHNVE